jgi:hypothetical protein
MAYQTLDPSAYGGFIKVKDYAIEAGEACGGGMIEIGGFCHAIGHAFGWPDLFDKDGGTNGIGEWGLMGRGNWNTPESPAHPAAWSRAQMGWVVPTSVGPGGAIESIPQIESNAVAFRLEFSDDRFRRMTECALNGTYSLRCALDTPEAATRGWAGGDGYGNDWSESIEREFHSNGAGPIVFAYSYQYDLEANYDSAFVSITVGGTETVLATYNGTGSGAEALDLSPFLTVPVDYSLRLRVVTDGFGSDEDGRYLSACGALVIDDVSVTGGAQLVNSGLLIWHVDEEVMGSLLGNTGGSGDTTVRGLVLEEADGIGHLLQNPGNAGDAGDPYPGSTGNTRFDALSTPPNHRNTGPPTVIEVSAISPSRPVMSALLRAGDPAPSASDISPDIITNDLDTVDVQINGADFRHGATFRLEMSGEADITPVDLYWQDSGRLQGKIKIFSRRGGSWSLVVNNPDGQQSVKADALTVVQIVAAQLVFATISVQDGGVEMRFELTGKEADETLIISRAGEAAGPWQRLPGEPQEIRGGLYRYVDGSAAPGRDYYYRLDVQSGDGSVRELYRGSVVLPALRLVLEQNHPNPFNPTTTLAYVLPEATHVRLDIFDISGALVRTVVNTVEQAGHHSHLWDGRDGRGNPVGSGVYVYRLRAGKATLSRKMMVLK